MPRTATSAQSSETTCQPCRYSWSDETDCIADAEHVCWRSSPGHRTYLCTCGSIQVRRDPASGGEVIPERPGQAVQAVRRLTNAIMRVLAYSVWLRPIVRTYSMWARGPSAGRDSCGQQGDTTGEKPCG